MAEKATTPQYEADNVQPESTVADQDQSNQLSHDVAKLKINGGTLAWLNVLAGFCVFVNSW
jgi:hypothetical protein